MDTAIETSNYKSVKRTRFTLNAISAFQVIIACIMISGATSVRILFREYRFTHYYSSLENLPSLWIATGCFLLIFSIFGFFATFKSSTMLLNLYGLSLSFVFILNVASAITGFTLLPKSEAIVGNALNAMIYGYEYRYRSLMDWIQKTYQCCGRIGPSDWGFEVPQSCCFMGSNWHQDDFNCSVYHYEGCTPILSSMASNGILIIAVSALVIGLFQFSGIICSFVLASRVRLSKTEKAVKKWAQIQNPFIQKPDDLKPEPAQPENQKEDDANRI